MKTFSFYNEETGVFSGDEFSTSDIALLNDNTPPGFRAYAGRVDELSQRVDIATGELVEYQPPAPEPADEYEWNAPAKRWRIRSEVATKRAKRTVAQIEIDRLERGQNRALREHAIGKGQAKKTLEDIEAAIEVQREIIRANG
jgi:hypothetical protein